MANVLDIGSVDWGATVLDKVHAFPLERSWHSLSGAKLIFVYVINQHHSSIRILQKVSDGTTESGGGENGQIGKESVDGIGVNHNILREKSHMI
jgi:hypothetical protein